MLELGRIWRICLEGAVIFGHLPLTVRSRLGVYTRAMMIKRILTICAAVTAGAAATSLALAQGYPPIPPAVVYSTAPQPYLPGGYPADYRRARGVPDFDPLEDDEAPDGQIWTTLPPLPPCCGLSAGGAPCGAGGAPGRPPRRGGCPGSPPSGRPGGPGGAVLDRGPPPRPGASAGCPALGPPARRSAGLFRPWRSR